MARTENGTGARGVPAWDGVLRDLRFGARGLVRSPGHTLVVSLTLALGIGATTALFSLVDGVLLRPLPYPDEDRLLVAWEESEQGSIRPTSYPSFQDWERRVRSIESMGFVRGDEFRLRGEEGTERLLAAYVSPGFFSTLGTPPLLGRTFAEPAAGEENVVVLSHDTWIRRWGGDDGVLGRAVSTSGGTYTVVGVMPPGFRAPAWAELWLPIQALPPDMRYALTRRDLHVDAETWVRLDEGATLDGAGAELSGIVADLAALYPEAEGGTWESVSLVPVRERLLAGAAAPLRIMGGAVALLLLIVFVNVANLQIDRGAARRQEMAVRASLGAGRGRLARQLMAENLLLALLGGAAGVAVAFGALALLRNRVSGVLPRVDQVGVDPRTLAFAAGVALLSAVAFGLLPSLRASSVQLAARLRDGTAGSGEGAATARLREGLVVVQVALALVLTVGAGLLVRSMQEVTEVDPGFRPEGLTALRVFPPAAYARPDAAAALYGQLRDAVAAVRGVEEVALVNHLPMAGGFITTRVLTSGEPPESGPYALYRSVSHDYTRVMGIEVLRGRGLREADMTGPGGGVLVNETFARSFFPDGDAVGEAVTIHRVAQGRDDLGEPMVGTVVGVVGDERFFSLEAPPPPAVFVPYTWSVWPNIYLVARSADDPSHLTADLRGAVRGVDPEIPVAGPGAQARWSPMEEIVGGTLAERRFQAGLLAAFAASALGLAVLGILGVTAYLVVRRRREIGLRMALGAGRREVASSILGHALKLVLAGLALGAVGAWAGTRFVRAQLFGVTPLDPWVLGTTVLVFGVAALAAAALPTARALAISPSRALRQD